MLAWFDSDCLVVIFLMDVFIFSMPSNVIITVKRVYVLGHKHVLGDGRYKCHNWTQRSRLQKHVDPSLIKVPFVKSLRHESFAAQWLEHPTVVRKVIGSISVGDSDFSFFLCPVLVTCWVARSYLYACWLCFWFAFFRMKDSTDFYDFWHTKQIIMEIQENVIFFCRYKNFWDIGIYPTTDFSLTSANKLQSSLILFLQVWRQLWP